MTQKQQDRLTIAIAIILIALLSYAHRMDKLGREKTREIAAQDHIISKIKEGCR